ncbi:hypothetical protein J1605_020557 [Eschrichtius robustus]|uniref:Uncharacterized protein n=1 Tax=Eschrichtius robustus TaxID=9764 RepID=A0AB34HM03_ESCRO|nr:hypothetical protein J1605_020557 [Eschrichtius robustus]
MKDFVTRGDRERRLVWDALWPRWMAQHTLGLRDQTHGLPRSLLSSRGQLSAPSERLAEGKAAPAAWSEAEPLEASLPGGDSAGLRCFLLVGAKVTPEATPDEVGVRSGRTLGFEGPSRKAPGRATLGTRDPPGQSPCRVRLRLCSGQKHRILSREPAAAQGEFVS